MSALAMISGKLHSEPFKRDAREQTQNREKPKPVEFKTLAAFAAEYVPLDYTVEPIIRGGSLYTLTAKTGAGKTALMVVKALAIATGRRDLLSLDVAKGRVAYLTAENPDDTRMRFMIACYLLNIDFAEIADRVVILDRREKPEDVAAGLMKLAEQEPFALIQLDTLAAFFDGKDINNPVEGGEFLVGFASSPASRDCPPSSSPRTPSRMPRLTTSSPMAQAPSSTRWTAT